MTEPDDKTDDPWRRELDAETFQITRQGGTERAFTGAYWDTKTPGVYRCRCCDAELFSSDHKYDSGSGWPSYWQPLESSRVREIEDESHGMVRTEVRCTKCDAHLGHVFPDGPKPTGHRYCINSASLKLDAEKVDADEDQP